MSTKKTTTVVRAGVGVLTTLGLALSAALVGGPAEARKAKTSQPQFRSVTAPNTHYPVIGTKRVKDLRTYSKRHKGTDIRTSCGATVRASTPGIVQIAENPAWGGKVVVRVVTHAGGVVTSYGWLWSPTVEHGQIVQSGQKLGILGGNPRTKACTLYFSVAGGGKHVNPSTWLNGYVGRPGPTRYLFGTTGFTVASFNVLGASHTPRRGFKGYAERTPRALALLKRYGTDVVGLQEFEPRQAKLMMADPTFRIFNGAFLGGKPDSRNAIIWRHSTMEFIEGHVMPIKYFQNTIKIPVVHLRHRASGRTAWFINTHNPASGVGYGNQAANRAYDVAVQKAKMIELRATGRPVFLMGDFNDREKAFCPLTANKLSISPNSIPAVGCAYPKTGVGIDWIFAAGQVRFSTYAFDKSPKTAGISDHPIVVTRAHLQN